MGKIGKRIEQEKKNKESMELKEASKEGRREGRKTASSGAIFAVRPSFPLLTRLFLLSQDLSVLFLESRQVLAQSWTLHCLLNVFRLFTKVNASLPEVDL